MTDYLMSLMDKNINKICYGDSENFLKLLPDDSCDICCSSPPYKFEDGFLLEKMWRVWDEIFRILKSNSLFFLNFGHLSDDKNRPFRTLNLALESGFKLNDTIVWVKNHYTPLNGKKHLNNLTEFIFILYKEKMPNLDRLSIGIPYKDKSNIGRYSNKDLKCAGNVWYINIPTITKKSQRLHKDEYPLELPEKCIKLSGLKSGILIDPFSGSFTSQIAAQKLGLNWIGIDKNYINCQKAQDRFFKEFNQEIDIIRI